MDAAASQMDPHSMAGLAARIPGLWPLPTPRFCAARSSRPSRSVSTPGFPVFCGNCPRTAASAVGSMPVQLGREGAAHSQPALTTQEQTALYNALS